MRCVALWCLAVVLGGAEALSAPMTAAGKVGVIFDIDGTMCDSFALGFGATQTVLEANGYPTIDADEYHAGCVYTTPERLSRHAVGTFDEALGAELGGQFDETYIALVDERTAGFYDGMPRLLRRIRDSGATLGALTNAAVLYAEAVLTANGVRDDFGSVQGANSVPRAKPHPDGLWQVARELGLEPARCVYVGDAPSDGAAARAAGFASVGCSYGSHAEQKLIDSGHFDVICASVDAVETALFPEGHETDADALASLCASRHEASH